MEFIEAIVQLLPAKIRSFYYSHLSRHIKAEHFDDLLCLLFSGHFKPDPKSLERRPGRFFFERAEKESYVKILKQYYPETLESTLAEADLALNHVFDLLGSGPINLGHSIDWHRDFKSGNSWGSAFYKDIKSIRDNEASDIKVPWELSRFHHFSTLGRAYWVSGDEKYAREFVSQLLDWMRCNPPRIGVNWYFSMEVAIRLVNWISAYFFFRDSPSFTEEARTAFFRSLLIHQIFIYHNLEFAYRVKQDSKTKNVNGNHYLTNLIGLIIPGFVFPNLSSKYLRRKALRWLYEEMLSQVNEDGVHCELSVGYHRLVTEMLLLVLIIMRENGQTPPDLMFRKTQQMLDFVSSYTRPDGIAPPST